jgi:hypothetical protein
MRYLLRGLVAIGTLALAGLAIGAASGATDPRMAVNVTSATAVSAVARLTGAVDLAATGPFTAVDHRYYAVDGKNVHANVDAFTGAIRTLALLANAPTGTDVAVAKADAAASAAAFLDAYGISTAGLSATVKFVDHGSMTEFVVTYERRVNGALVPDTRSVSINPATGAVFGLTTFSRVYVDPPKATITLDEATKAGLDVAGMTDGQLVHSDLVVTFDAAGAQLLVWRLELVGSDGGAAAVQVDALSGAGQLLGRG